MNANLLKQIESANISPDARALVLTLAQHPGANIPVTWERDCATYKEVTKNVRKRTTALVRAGIDFANLASVQSGIASGERGEIQPLPAWQEWACDGYILRHKVKGTEYIRLFPSSFGNATPKVEYFIDGVPATLAEVTPMLQASERRERDEVSPVFNVKVDSILRAH